MLLGFEKFPPNFDDEIFARFLSSSFRLWSTFPLNFAGHPTNNASARDKIHFYFRLLTRAFHSEIGICQQQL